MLRRFYSDQKEAQNVVESSTEEGRSRAAQTVESGLGEVGRRVRVGQRRELQAEGREVRDSPDRW